MVPAMVTLNVCRQQQCQGTPTMRDPFLQDFSFLADTPSADAVMLGTYSSPPSLDPYLKELIFQLWHPPSITALGQINPLVTPKQHQAAWCTQDERSASKPSCLGFSHYKAASSDPFLNNVDTHLRNILLDIGFSPLAWQMITGVEILKKPNEFLIDKMRLIQLMSAKFQICNNNISRPSLAHGERASAISANQHGSRKHHWAIKTCLNKKQLSVTSVSNSVGRWPLL